MRFGTSLGTDIDDYNNISLAVDINKLLVPTPPADNNPSNGTYSAGKIQMSE